MGGTGVQDRIGALGPNGVGPRRTDAQEEHVGARCSRLTQLLDVPRRMMPFIPTISVEKNKLYLLLAVRLFSRKT